MQSASVSGLKAVLERMIDALRAEEVPVVEPWELPCFAPGALAGDPNVSPESLSSVLAALSAADIPTLERAIEAIDGNERAWMGFKLVTDPEAVLDSDDTDVVGIRGEGMGSADALPGVFLVINPGGERAEAEIVFSRSLSKRDRFQILDITRGPAMHDEQYAGVAWKSMPLFRRSQVLLLGASTLAAEVERVAQSVEFETVVVDDDPAYLTAERFPLSQRVLIESFDTIPDLGVTSDDYICVLTRGHMHDPQALAFGLLSGADYVGMVGHPQKNARVFDLAEEAGVDRARLEATHAPIGLKFGARTPAELAIAIVAELIQVRAERRKRAIAPQA